MEARIKLLESSIQKLQNAIEFRDDQIESYQDTVNDDEEIISLYKGLSEKRKEEAIALKKSRPYEPKFEKMEQEIARIEKALRNRSRNADYPDYVERLETLIKRFEQKNLPAFKAFNTAMRELYYKIVADANKQQKLCELANVFMLKMLDPDCDKLLAVDEFTKACDQTPGLEKFLKILKAIAVGVVVAVSVTAIILTALLCPPVAIWIAKVGCELPFMATAGGIGFTGGVTASIKAGFYLFKPDDVTASALKAAEEGRAACQP